MPYADTGEEVGALVDRKNRAYGDSFTKSGEVLKILYPNGVKPGEYKTLLAVTRIIDKLFRIATDKHAFGETPWTDIAGYAILMVEDERNVDTTQDNPSHCHGLCIPHTGDE